MTWKTLGYKTFRDSTGRVALFQRPNVPIASWAVFLALSKIGNNTDFTTCAKAISATSLLFWATLEITTGVNYFRRILGLVVFVATISHYL